MSEKFTSGIDEGRLDKSKDEACLLLYFGKLYDDGGAAMTAIQESKAEKIIMTVPIDEIKEALLNEYRRRIIRCKMVDETMKKKYGMTFQEFESKNVVKEQGFSWQVESDAMEWEHAVEGNRYAEQKLKGISQ